MRILMYHQVAEGHPPNVHAVNSGELARQMKWLRESGYRSIHFDDYRPGPGKDRHRTVAITFDDGYLDVLTVALPILREQGFVATVFLIAGLMGKCRQWPDGADSSCPPFLTWAQAREAGRDNVRFGSHTMTHPDLTTISAAMLEAELGESRRLIEQETGTPTIAFAYPYGRENPRVRRLARETGYRLACTGPVGYAGAPGNDIYQLKRVTVLATDTLDDFAQKVQGNLQRRLAWYARLLRSRLRNHYTRRGAAPSPPARHGP
jgi:peptidoglycan/xylan/chitin deacetylase (PgdA/CDA1 family)